VPEIEHAWLWDHFVPLYGDPGGPILEGWTLLAALAARTTRLELRLMVTANAARLPAVLGIGVGGTALDRPNQELVLREYAGYGLPLVAPDEGIARLAETCAIVRRMWTEEVFDFAGRHYRLTGCRNEPKPVRRPPRGTVAGRRDHRALVPTRQARLP
jgi:alkanesulfonate monooxygenase SsuD/methylene tetrahydromethanopterin reductase-like flavin-dependent oxidoreductase (luciferase family)